jgi:hypothetical protein
MPRPTVYIVEYLIHISRDQEALKQYERDPDAAMKAYGLDDNQRAAVKSGNSQQLEEHIACELQLTTMNTTVSMTTKTTNKL